PEISPQKRDGYVTVCVICTALRRRSVAARTAAPCRLRLGLCDLIKLDLINFEFVTFRLRDSMEIHAAGRKKDDRHVETIRRIRCFDVRLQRSRTPIARFLQYELEFA